MNLLRLVRPIKNLVVPDARRFRTVRRGLCRGLELQLNPRNDLWIMYGFYEPEIASHVRRLVSPGDVCYDLGAADGYYTMAMARLAAPDGRVIAFEPDAPRRAEMHETLKRNEPLGSPIEVHGHFVGRTHDPDGGSISIDRSVASGTMPPPDLIKMDIEGGEHAALAGSIETIRKHRPRAIVEVHSGELRSTCRELLENEGYDVENVEQDTRFFRDEPKMDRSWLVAEPGPRP